MTQADLAAKAGTSQPQIHRLENDKRPLSKKWAERLAPHLGVTPEALMFPGTDRLYGKLRLLPPDIAELLEDQFSDRIDSEIELEKRRSGGN